MQSGIVIEHGIGQGNQFHKWQLGLPGGDTSCQIHHLQQDSANLTAGSGFEAQTCCQNCTCSITKKIKI